MRYWGLLAGKGLLAFLVLQGLWAWMEGALKPQPERWFGRLMDPLGTDVWWTLAVFAYWLLAAGLCAVALLDQKYRCRTCARRLRMPVETGSWANMTLLGRPSTEYICAYGHGKLRVANVEFDGRVPARWREYGEWWHEIFRKDSQ